MPRLPSPTCRASTACPPIPSEEIVTAISCFNTHPDGIINIVDASNIERNLYLTMQLMELNIPLVLALNMMDEVRANGGTIMVNELEELLGVPVVPISAAKNEASTSWSSTPCTWPATARHRAALTSATPGTARAVRCTAVYTP